MTRWGLVATIKADLPEILRFAAWHLELGAHRLYLYLDEDPHGDANFLTRHPKLRVTVTDDAHWQKRGGRPAKHQVRQVRNAQHANRRKADCHWLAHIDVDEFLLPARPLAAQLAATPEHALCARVRPIEALAPDDGHPSAATLFKAFPIDQTRRQQAAEACFPTWGRHLSGGFLSHVAGKLFFRTGHRALEIRIHNVILDGVQNPGEVALADTELGHFHAATWERFVSALPFRRSLGSYRAELRPQARRPGALNLHALLEQIEAQGGIQALRAFYEEVAVANSDLCARLRHHGLLRAHAMPFDALVARHFPEIG